MRPWSPDSDEVRRVGGGAVECTDEASGVCSSSAASRNPEVGQPADGADFELSFDWRLALYESLGFRYGPVPAVMVEKYRTADIFMSLELASDSRRHADY